MRIVLRDIVLERWGIILKVGAARFPDIWA
jgi:hypothetical protein